jgi:hypothetical protein
MKAFFTYASLISPVLFLVLNLIVRRQVRKKSRFLEKELKEKESVKEIAVKEPRSIDTEQSDPLFVKSRWSRFRQSPRNGRL